MRHPIERLKDKVLYDALLGDAQTGKNGGTTTSFDTSNQQVAVAASGLTLAKLKSTREILVGNEIEPGTEMFIAVTEKQMTDLLDTTEIASSDYNTVKALVRGEVNTFMGFRFIEFPGMKNNSNSLDGSSTHPYEHPSVSTLGYGWVLIWVSGMVVKLGSTNGPTFHTQPKYS